jgi:hypothetical protein
MRLLQKCGHVWPLRLSRHVCMPSGRKAQGRWRDDQTRLFLSRKPTDIRMHARTGSRMGCLAREQAESMSKILANSRSSAKTAGLVSPGLDLLLLRPKHCSPMLYATRQDLRIWPLDLLLFQSTWRLSRRSRSVVSDLVVRVSSLLLGIILIGQTIDTHRRELREKDRDRQDERRLLARSGLQRMSSHDMNLR